MALEIAKHAFTVSEFNQMAEAGILSEDDRVELIEGQVIAMSPIGKRHAACVDRFTSLVTKLGDNMIVRVQGPIQLDDYSEPQPDITLLRQRTDFYAGSLPRPSDVLLLIEVADTTTEYDRLIKLPAYARAGISEVWIENLPEDRIEMYSEPTGGAYKVVKHASRGEFIQSLTLADLRFTVDEILG
jgi:Uma2 family endonuclease